MVMHADVALLESQLYHDSALPSSSIELQNPKLPKSKESELGELEVLGSSLEVVGVVVLLVGSIFILTSGFIRRFKMGSVIGHIYEATW